MINYGKTYNKQVPVLISDKSIFCEGGGRLLSDIIYPVGSIYISVNSINPSVYFGGTWEQIKDRFLLACGNTYSNGTIGGEAAHKLTYNELPSEVVAGYCADNQKSWSTGCWGDYSTATYPTNVIRLSGRWSGNQFHNNMPPYLAVYIWKRIG